MLGSVCVTFEYNFSKSNHQSNTLMFFSIVMTVLSFFKERILRIMYPLPKFLEVSVPSQTLTVFDSISKHVIDALKNELPCPCEVVVEDDDSNGIKVQIDDEDIFSGQSSVLRYISRLSRLYPLTPQNALVVDTSMDKLFEFCTGELQAADVEKELNTLEENLSHSSAFLNDFQAATILDLAWVGAMQWFVENDLLPENWKSSFPHITAWMHDLRKEFPLASLETNKQQKKGEVSLKKDQ